MPITRIITAICLLAVFIPALFFASNQLWAFGMLLVSLLALDEWNRLLGWQDKASFIWVLISAVLGLWVVDAIETLGFHWVFFQSLSVFMVVSLFWLFVAPICLALRYFPENRLMMTLLGIVLIGGLWLAVICAKGADPWLLLSLLSTVWIADTSAYIAGKNFGKHKLAPAISPGKTWEGVIGALLGVTIFAAVLRFGFNIDNWLIFPALWLITVVGIMGDLFESLMKRRADVKDSGDMLPGHGGILDRLDAIIPSVPLAILLIYTYNYFKVF